MAITATIQELLQGIADSQYGRDMRQYIHDAIQKCYEDGSAGELDLQARQDIQKIYEIFGNVETGTTASQAYAEGDTFIYDGKLYKAITAIAQGDTFTEGTNIEEITVAGVNITPPNLSAIETIYSWENQTTSFTMDFTIEDDGWYALLVAHPSSSTMNYAQGSISVSPYNYNGIVASVTNDASRTFYLMTPWLYFKTGDVIRVDGRADDAFLRYAPCL